MRPFKLQLNTVVGFCIIFWVKRNGTSIMALAPLLFESIGMLYGVNNRLDSATVGFDNLCGHDGFCKSGNRLPLLLLLVRPFYCAIRI